MGGKGGGERSPFGSGRPGIGTERWEDPPLGRDGIMDMERHGQESQDSAEENSPASGSVESLGEGGGGGAGNSPISSALPFQPCRQNSRPSFPSRNSSRPLYCPKTPLILSQTVLPYDTRLVCHSLILLSVSRLLLSTDLCSPPPSVFASVACCLLLCCLTGAMIVAVQY